MNATWTDRRWHSSIRLRITAAATIAVALVLGLMSALLIAFQLNSALAHLDEILSDEAEAIGVAVANGLTLPTLLDDDRVVIVFDPTGEVMLAAGDYGELAELTVITDDDKGVNRTFSDQAHRVVSEPFDHVAGGVGRVVLAEPRDELDDSVERLIRSLAVVVPIAIGALALLVWVVVGRTLRPVEQIRSQVASIGIHELDRRVPVPRGDDEVTRLAGTMNTMLSRLESSVRTQQRFVADASHELRTPLTRMRARLEVRAAASDAFDNDLAGQIDDVVGLQSMIDDLLLLARTDARSDLGNRTSVDLDDILLEELAGTSPTLSVDSRDVSGAQVHGVPGQLRRMVRNLLDNAEFYANERIAVALREHNGLAIMTIDDDGPGIPEDQRQLALERFSRLDGARVGSGRSGLGLAIVNEIVAWHDGEIELGESPLGGTRVTIRLAATS